MKPLRVCVVGAGQFASCFLPLFRAHPSVASVALCEVMPERLRAEAGRFQIADTMGSYEAVLARHDIDAVALFTQRWLHAPMALAALRAGKHVYSAVPAATTLQELHELVETVRRTGLTYMMGETSLYYGARLYCRERWDEGAFGHFVYGEGDYYHDMSHGFYEAYAYSGGSDWKRTASFPPMLYPTHSVAMVLSVTGARATDVSCLGWVDRSDDGVFDPEVSRWRNRFSNQSALFRTSDGGMMRINEFRRVGQRGGRSVRVSLYGTEGSFEEQSNGAIWTRRTGEPRSVEDEICCGGVHTHAQWQEIRAAVELRGEFTSGFGKIHRKYRAALPDAFRVQPNGHEGSHQFLVNDFVAAAVQGAAPTCSVWDAARFTAPGIVAHASSLREGERLPIPDFGDSR